MEKDVRDVKMVKLSLPPRLVGNTRATLEVRIDTLKVFGDDGPADVGNKLSFVRLLWWGQNPEDAVTFPMSRIGSGMSALYKIVCRLDRFRDYLRDAGRLFVEATDQSGQTFGFGVVERLERIIDFGGLSSDDIEVFNENGDVVAQLRCIFMFEEMQEMDVAATRHASKLPRKVVLASKKGCIKPQYSQTVSPPKMRGVTFSGIPKSLNDDDSSSSVDDENGAQENLDNDDYDEVISQVLEDTDDVELRRLLRHSQSRTCTLPKSPRQSAVIIIEADAVKSTWSSEGGNLPTWNLSTERLKFMSQVNNLAVKIRKVTLNPAVVPHVASFIPSSEKAAAKKQPSFFLKYSLPRENQETTFCAKKSFMPIKVSSKARKVHSASEDSLTFDAKSQHPLRFNTSLLDSWWVSSLNLHLHTRHLRHRMSNQIGEATLGLKHLLMNSKYSSGAEMKLPIYSSTTFRRHLQSHCQEEIIGDIHVTFTFTKESESLSATTAAVRISKVVAAEVEVAHYVPPKAVIESKATLPAKKASTKIDRTRDLILCLLRLDEGRNFSFGSKATTCSLYLTCRLFSDTECISSSVCWNSTRPKFEMQHVVPMDMSAKFLQESCRHNHLVVEVWNFAEPSSEIVGIAKLSLHQLYTAFHVSFISSALLLLILGKSFIHN